MTCWHRISHKSAILLLLFTCVATIAGNSFFSSYVRTLTFAPQVESGSLGRVNVESGKVTSVPLSPEWKDKEIT